MVKPGLLAGKLPIPDKPCPSQPRQAEARQRPAPACGMVGAGPVNPLLGLTFYCWRLARRLCRPVPVEGLRTMQRLPARLLASAAVLVALATGGCSTTSRTGPDVTGSIGDQAGPHSETEWRQEMEAWGARYRANPADPQAAIRYARALRGIGQRVQAAAVLEQGAVHNPKNRAVLGAYGRALADAGNLRQALEVLDRAHSQDDPDWRILSVKGAVLDQMGRHADAQRHYASALRLKPDEPSVLSNLGLSYALSKNLPKAEATLRKAAAQPGAEPKVRQNLALVVGLQGRFKEAEAIAGSDLSPTEAAANVAYLRRMLSQQSAWKKDRRGSPLTPTTGQ
jgi:Flp pilus assembly protein TadD